ncbi:hypothetical protein A6P39_007680 [Streptomyces sp. FXJ1.172]|jgi:hypothetical protein|uniref:hypothetical protein n=1 Tax=Streptomyces sp. FXJ1.172 TaxID=710705 RepID=UPI0007CF0B95|nr:hypothetical protein [Streptomyces sp. FXJ1.172]WEO93899.1 hypothetical protein A6P39_007680 [Streptomyces sp. FXJ1.172]
MSERVGSGPRAEPGCCGAPLPSARKARRRAGRPSAGTAGSSPRGPNGDRLLLPDGTWRHVETLRVPSLFG